MRLLAAVLPHHRPNREVAVLFYFQGRAALHLRLPVPGGRPGVALRRTPPRVAIGFDNGDADFSLYGILGRLQGIKKGMAYMCVLVYVIHEARSVDGNAAALHA